MFDGTRMHSRASGPTTLRMVVAFAAAVAPALASCQLGNQWDAIKTTHSKPMLMATVAPIFSFLLICWLSRYFHGSRAMATSTAAEYADDRSRR